jgi:hypothetical protein
MDVIQRHLKSIGVGLPALMQTNRMAAGQGPGALLVSQGQTASVVGFAPLDQIPEEETEIRRLASATAGGQTALMTVVIFEGRERHVYQVSTLVCWQHFKDGFIVAEEVHLVADTPPDPSARPEQAGPVLEDSHGNPDPFDTL